MHDTNSALLNTYFQVRWQALRREGRLSCLLVVAQPERLGWSGRLLVFVGERFIRLGHWLADRARPRPVSGCPQAPSLASDL